MCIYLLGHGRFIIVPLRHFCPAEMDQEGKVQGSVYCGMMERKGRGEFWKSSAVRKGVTAECGGREGGVELRDQSSTRMCEVW